MKHYFFVADEMQTLEGGKTLMVGVYTNRVIVLNEIKEVPGARDSGKANVIGLPRLAMMMTIDGLAAGNYVARLTVYQPDGTSDLIKFPEMPFEVRPGTSANLLMQFQPFLMKGPGIYKVLVAVDDHRFEGDLEVRIGNA